MQSSSGTIMVCIGIIVYGKQNIKAFPYSFFHTFTLVFFFIGEKNPYKISRHGIQIINFTEIASQYRVRQNVYKTWRLFTTVFLYYTIRGFGDIELPKDGVEVVAAWSLHYVPECTVS